MTTTIVAVTTTLSLAPSARFVGSMWRAELSQRWETPIIQSASPVTDASESVFLQWVVCSIADPLPITDPLPVTDPSTLLHTSPPVTLQCMYHVLLLTCLMVWHVWFDTKVTFPILQEWDPQWYSGDIQWSTGNSLSEVHRHCPPRGIGGSTTHCHFLFRGAGLQITLQFWR